jgi:hypothetical protein
MQAITNISDYRNRPSPGSRVYWSGDMCNRPHRYEVTGLDGHFMRLRDLDDGASTTTPIALLDSPRWSRECPDAPVTILDPPDPYARRYGARYEETKGETRAQLAARIRADIRAAVKAGTIPAFKYSVRTRTYSGGGAIDVTAYLPAGVKRWTPTEDRDDVPHAARRPQQNPICETIEKTVNAITWAYNYDGSNSMIDWFDRRFYGSVDFEEA